jgi:hypothetical protein
MKPWLPLPNSSTTVPCTPLPPSASMPATWFYGPIAMPLTCWHQRASLALLDTVFSTHGQAPHPPPQMIHPQTMALCMSSVQSCARWWPAQQKSELGVLFLNTQAICLTFFAFLGIKLHSSFFGFFTATNTLLLNTNIWL